MHRIFFDANTGNHEEGYELRFALSLADLESIGDELREGLMVILYMPGELEIKSVLSFDKKCGFWRGIPK